MPVLHARLPPYLPPAISPWQGPFMSGSCLLTLFGRRDHMQAQKHPSVNILAGNGFPKSPQAYCITQGTYGVHVGELTGLLWGVHVGVNIPNYCEMTYSHLRQRACPDSPGPVLHPGDLVVVSRALESQNRYFTAQRWSDLDFDELRWPPQNFHRDRRHGFVVYGSLLNIPRRILIIAGRVRDIH